MRLSFSIGCGSCHGMYVPSFLDTVETKPEIQLLAQRLVRGLVNITYVNVNDSSSSLRPGIVPNE